MTTHMRFTARQIVHKIGRRNLTKLLRVGEPAMRRWYSGGIPARHWPKLVRAVDWLSYEILEDATTIAERGQRRRAA